MRCVRLASPVLSTTSRLCATGSVLRRLVASDINTLSSWKKSTQRNLRRTPASRRLGRKREKSLEVLSVVINLFSGSPS